MWKALIGLLMTPLESRLAERISLNSDKYLQNGDCVRELKEKGIPHKWQFHILIDSSRLFLDEIQEAF
jgi:hypothetical protein